MNLGIVFITVLDSSIINACITADKPLIIALTHVNI